MALPLPVLDDRRWADLVEEGRALVPLYAPRWSDHNLHDPGITLVELLAFAAEAEIYRLDRLPPERRRKLLALLGIHPEPPRGARVAVGFGLDPGPAMTLPAGVEIEGDDPFGAPVRFALRRALHVVPGTLAAFQQGAVAGGQPTDLTPAWRRGEPLAVLGSDPAVGAAAYFGFDFPAGVPALPFALHLEIAGGDADAPAVHHSARLAWEALVAGGTWRALAVDDPTRAFTRSGGVELRLPGETALARVGRVERPLYWLRARLAEGALDAAPEVLAVLLNGGVAEQAVPVEGEALGSGSGRPAQTLDLAAPRVAAGPCELRSLENGGWRSWEERPDFDASRRDDAHFVLDRRRGRIVLGDGEHGRAAPAGAPLVASYLSTRGPEGELAAGALTRLAGSARNHELLGDLATVAARLEVAQPLAARGGSAGESLDAAAARAFDAAGSSERAITLADHEAQALATPGVSLARVSARAEEHPAFPCWRAPGVVTVLVLPHLPARRPRPSTGLLRAVRAHLSARRLLGTRVEVAGPVYVEVAVVARVRACRGVDRAALVRRLASALDAFFDPLHGGPDGGGWPFGRDVYRAEVLQVLDEVPGCDHVLALELRDGAGRTSCTNLCVPPRGLVAALPHDVEVV